MHLCKQVQKFRYDVAIFQLRFPFCVIIFICCIFTGKVEKFAEINSVMVQYTVHVAWWKNIVVGRQWKQKWVSEQKTYKRENLPERKKKSIFLFQLQPTLFLPQQNISSPSLCSGRISSWLARISTGVWLIAYFLNQAFPLHTLLC